MIKSIFFSSYVLLFGMFSLLATICNGQYTEKQVKQLNKMEIKAAIYAMEVNEPLISEIIIRDRRHRKLLIPAILLASISIPTIIYGFEMDKKHAGGDVKAYYAFFAYGGAAAIGSISIQTYTIVNRTKRNKLIARLNK